MMQTDQSETKPATKDAVESLRERVSVDLRTGMKIRDTALVATLRCLLGVLDNAGAVDPSLVPASVYGQSRDVPRRTVAAAELQSLLEQEMTSRRRSALEYDRLGRPQDAARLHVELTVLARYLAP